MLRKQLVGRGMKLNFVGVSPKIRKVFRLNKFDYLLEEKLLIDVATKLFVRNVPSNSQPRRLSLSKKI